MPARFGVEAEGKGGVELQRLIGPMLDEVYDAVHVDGDDDGLLNGMANLTGDSVGSAYAFLQGDVFLFGDQELGVVTSELEVFHHGSGNFAVVLVLAEASVGRAFAVKPRESMLMTIFVGSRK